MRIKYVLVGIAVGVLLTTAAVALAGTAGTLEPVADPANTLSYTLEDIYQRLNDGTTVISTTFAEPDAGPVAGTMHTLNDIYDLVGKRAPVPKTGQTKCYNNSASSEQNCPVTGFPGQDGDLQKGVDWVTSTRFITGTTGTMGVTVVVTDTLTGLIWLQDANCISTTHATYNFDNDDPAGDGRVTWEHALEFVAGITVTGSYSDCAAGFSDWRLPNVREQESLIDYGEYTPALPDGHPFTGVQSYNYWSSSTHAGDTRYARYVGLNDGVVAATDKKTHFFYVWPVRGGQ